MGKGIPIVMSTPQMKTTNFWDEKFESRESRPHQRSSHHKRASSYSPEFYPKEKSRRPSGPAYVSSPSKSESLNTELKPSDLSMQPEKVKGLNLFVKMGLTPDYAQSLMEDWEELNYYEDAVSHFISMLWHSLRRTEVLTENTNISKILQDVGFSLETSNHLHNAILEDTYDLSLFHWVNYYVREILADADDYPSWLKNQGNHKLGVPFQETISLSNENCSNKDIQATWIDLQGLASQIDEIEDANSGSGTDKYWYHCTSPSSAIEILQDGVVIKQAKTLVHLGNGFYVSNNFSSVARYIQKTWKVCPKVPAAIIFVFKWDESKQETFRDRLLDLVTVDENDPERTKETLNEQTKDIIEFNKKKFNDGHMKFHDLEKEKSLILAIDTKDKNNYTFGRSTELQMCIRDDDAADEFTNSFQEIFLLSKENYESKKSFINEYEMSKKRKIFLKTKLKKAKKNNI